MEIHLLHEEPDFSIGDLVRVNTDRANSANVLSGDRGSIVRPYVSTGLRFDDDLPSYFTVKMESNDREYIFEPRYLEKDLYS
jgi:hypothetical protein